MKAKHLDRTHQRAQAGLGQGLPVMPFQGMLDHPQVGQEIFGPVASVMSFKTVEEAIGIANDTIYGLAAGIWTRDLNLAMRLVREVQAGTIWINSFDEGDMTQPFGGYKQSGHARDKCMESLLSYTQSKSAWFRLSGQR